MRTLLLIILALISIPMLAVAGETQSYLTSNKVDNILRSDKTHERVKILTDDAAVSAYSEASIALKKGNYTRVVEIIKPLAEQGYSMAQFDYSLMHIKGIGVLINFQEAEKWMRLAAEQKLAQAQYGLGVMYETGKWVPQDFQEAAKWYHLAADQSLREAQFKLGTMYEVGKGVPKNLAKAREWYIWSGVLTLGYQARQH